MFSVILYVPYASSKLKNVSIRRLNLKYQNSYPELVIFFNIKIIIWENLCEFFKTIQITDDISYESMHI